MLSYGEIGRITRIITAASASTEGRFLDIGGQLGTAVDTIGTLTLTFDRLANELKGENLRGATQQLSRVMTAVATARVDDGKRTVFKQLADLITKIQERIAQMGKAVSDLGMLAMNTRIEAANIGDAGRDFPIFTTEISRTLGLAHTSLDDLANELRGVGDPLRLAATSEVARAQHRADAIRSVPGRLGESIAAITDSGKRAVAAASVVAQQSRKVGQSISDAVMALQIGDITRQRLDHIEFALTIVAEILGPPSVKLAQHGDWTALTGPQRHALGGFGSRLLSAQLLDASDEFDREMRQILSSVEELATDAGAILHLGSSAAGAADDGRRTFLGKVEEQVAEVGKLLAGAATARREADTLSVSVSEATERLVSHTTTLRSLEEDIRIMGLNMSLKCGRLGAVGQPLMVIAQELRSYSHHIATEAAAITVHVDSMAAIAGSLRSGERYERAAHGASIAASMADSVSRLGAAGESLANALASLAQDTESVAALLRDTVARATVHEELTKDLRVAAADLASATGDSDPEEEIASPELEHLIGLVAGCYTMERERIIHDRQLNGRMDGRTSLVRPPAEMATVPADLEDTFL
jgi:hypothetical protein